MFDFLRISVQVFFPVRFFACRIPTLGSKIGFWEAYEESSTGGK